MRFIDADKLMTAIKKTDLGFMQNSDVIECIEDIISKQVIAENKYVVTSDNRKIVT